MTKARDLSQVPNASLAFKNRIINGDMRIDQRNNGASVANPNGGLYTLDRWSIYGTQTSRFNCQQNAGSVTPPTGFINYLGVTSSSAYSVTSTDIFSVRHIVEGLNCADLAWGTSSASAVTLSFWVRSSITGTFGGAFTNSSQNRSYPFTYTISAANTWEQKSIVIPGDTTGTWLTTNGKGIDIFFSLGTGSTYSGTAGSWSGNTFYSATGATSVVGTNGATFYITGVQLEKGSTATSFDYRPFTVEETLCKRYCEFMNFSYVTIGYKGGGVSFKVTKRAVPTVTFYSRVDRGGTVGSLQEVNASGSDFSVASSEPRTDGFTAINISGVSINATMAGSLIASAEL